MTIVQALSQLLLWTGALIFFLGGKALHEFWKVGFALGELAGIGCGLVLMFAAAAMQQALPECKRMQFKKRHG